MINVACYTNDKCDQPATVDRGSKVSEIPDPINSTGAPQPTGERGAISSPQTPTPRCSTRSTKGVPPVCYTPSRSEWISDFHVCKLCSDRTIS